MKKTVTLNPGESKVVAFSFTPTVAKGYTVSVDGLVGSFIALEMPIEVRLKNPPPKGNYWRLILFNEVWGASLTVGTHIPADQAITLASLPYGWGFPLYIDIFIYEIAVAPFNIVYKVQSAYGPDWPDYRDVTIPDYGTYRFNVATEQFEAVQ